jgi:hypothetical protein
MKEGCQKSKTIIYGKVQTLSYRCTEDKGREERRETAKSLQFLKFMKATFNCGGNTRHQSAGVKRHKGNSLDPSKDDFLKLVMQYSRFFKRDTRLDCL